MKKKIFILFLLLILFFLLYKSFKSTFVGADFFNTQISEDVFEEKGEIEMEEIEEVSSGAFEINVPAHWKYGKNIDKEDFLAGYLPTMKTYSKNTLDTGKLLYGTEITPPLAQFGLKEVERLVERDNLFYSSNHVRNESDYYDWSKGKCFEVSEAKKIKKMYICENWYKWYLGDKKNVVFTYTDCTIDGISSYCLFADYVKDFFDESIEKESRCITSSQKKEDLCDVDNYVNLVLL